MKKALLLSFLAIFMASCSTVDVVENWDTVKVHYKWTLTDGEQFDSSYDRGEPLEFTAWAGEMIAWFDAAVIWMTTWEKKSISLSPEEAYGERTEENYDVIKKEELSSFEENGIVIQTWAILPTMYGNFEIVWISGEDVTVDMNHPLAGETLNFDIELMEIVK